MKKKKCSLWKGMVCAWVMLGVVACTGKQTDEQQNAAKEVKTLTTEVKTVEVPLRVPAQLHGKQDIAIVPQVTATIEEVLVQEGDHVEKGQRMFVLHQTAYQAAVDNAAAEVASAETQVQTEELELSAKKQLLDKNIISEHEYRVQENRVMIARASLSKAQALLRNANNDLGFTIIKAPHTGVVGTINYKQGALVGPQIQEPMTVVSDNSVVYANVSITGDYYLYLLHEYGSKAKLIADMPPFSLILGADTHFGQMGHLETVSGIIDRSTGAVSMRIAFPNPNRILTAGGSGVVEVKFVNDSAIVLPRTAVFGIQDKNYACVVEADTIRQVMVEVERLNDTEYIVTTGLSAGEVVVTEGVKKLANGDKVVCN